ncbi:hypothetical protein D9M71_632140 [compost metagenome]
MVANHGRHRCEERRLGSATTPEEADDALTRQERINKVGDCGCFDIFRHGELQLDLVRVDGSRLGQNTVPHFFAFELLSFNLKLYLFGLGCFPLRLGYRLSLRDFRCQVRIALLCSSKPRERGRLRGGWGRDCKVAAIGVLAGVLRLL